MLWRQKWDSDKHILKQEVLQDASTATSSHAASHSLPAPQDAEESDGWKVLAHKMQSWQETEEMSVVGAPYSILLTSGICNKTECKTLA